MIERGGQLYRVGAHGRATTENTDLSDMVKDQYHKMTMEEMNHGVLKPASGSDAREHADLSGGTSKRRALLTEKTPSLGISQALNPIHQLHAGKDPNTASVGLPGPSEPSIEQKYGIDCQQ